jgi:integrase
MDKVTYSKQKDLLDGEITMFILATARKPTWQVRFKNPLDNNARYIRKTTGHTNDALATQRALEIYQEYQTRSHLGLRSGKYTIHRLYTEFIDQLGTVPRSMVKMYYNAYWKDYFANTDVTKLSTFAIRKYFKWRIDNHLANPDQRSGWVSSETSISFDNINNESKMLMVLLRKGFQHDIIARLPTRPTDMDSWQGVHTLPRNQRRGRFTKKEYQRLVGVFGSIRKGLENPKYKPVLVDPDREFCPDTNIWQSIAKRDAHIGRDERNPKYQTKKQRYPNATFWFASLLLANTGIRVSELVKLRHKDIKLVKDDDGELYTVVKIDETVSKIRKTREAISADGQETFRRYLLYRKELEYFFNRKLEQTDWVFPQPKGKNAYTGKREKLENLFRPKLKELGLHEKFIETRDTKTKHLVKVYCSAYSFRSWYITERLRNMLDPYTISKNCGVSIKTLMTSYDVNETWQFRKQMTQHLNWRAKVDYTATKEDRTELDGYIQSW